MDAFTKDRGTYQGRIAHADAPEGTFVYELGHSLLQPANVQVGDYHEISQVLLMEDQAHFVRASVILVTPRNLPIGESWEVSAWLRGERMVTRRLRPSKRVLVLSDWRIRLRALGVDEAPEMELKFRLELVSDTVPGDALLDEGGEALEGDDGGGFLIMG